MPLNRLQCACAAALAVQVGVLFSFASEENKNAAVSAMQGFGSFPAFMGSGSFLDFERSFAESLNAFMNAFGPMPGMMPSGGPSLSLSLSNDEEGKSCHVDILMADSLQPDEVKVGLHTSGGRVTVAYNAQAIKEQNDPEKGSSRSSSTVQLSSSLSLPERCLATTTVLLTSSAGYLLESKNSGEHQPVRGLIVFPSKELLASHVEMNLLPEDIVAVVESGDKQRLDELSPLQRCLVAGFTEAECAKLRNKKPDVVSVTPFVGATDVVPIPRYDADLEMLE
ncbi:hypothetical protein Efla_001046 [Eimeria flavescens]